MSTDGFFDDPREQSLVKAEIVAKYFGAWSKVVISTLKQYGGKKIAYIDLFAGPGRYEDETKSTPLLVLEKAICDPDLSQMLVTIFNDKDTQNAQSLDAAIQSLPGIEKLKHRPQVLNIEVDKAIVEQFEHMKLVPTLLFVDPWGYKGLSLKLIDAVLRNWGCDCVFFFNYNRINMGLQNDRVRDHMDALFGTERADELRKKLEYLKPYLRELMIVEELSQAFRTLGYKFVLPFRFRRASDHRLSHHLIFVTKSFRGYDIMKGVMARASTNAVQGVASFEYNPADKSMPLLFELNRPIDDLSELLLKEFAGKTLTLDDFYETHSVNKPYTKRNYQDVLLKLEAERKILTSPCASERRKNTFSSSLVKISFPKYRE